MQQEVKPEIADDEWAWGWDENWGENEEEEEWEEDEEVEEEHPIWGPKPPEWTLPIWPPPHPDDIPRLRCRCL